MSSSSSSRRPRLLEPNGINFFRVLLIGDAVASALGALGTMGASPVAMTTRCPLTPQTPQSIYSHSDFLQEIRSNLTVGVSTRPSHLIMTHILNFVLQDVLLFPSVELIKISDSFSEDEVVSYFEEAATETFYDETFQNREDVGVPKTMLNLEFVRTPGSGETFPPGMAVVEAMASELLFGWWVTKEWAESVQEELEVPAADHYLILRDPKATSRLRLDTTSLPIPSNLSCEAAPLSIPEWTCDGGVFVSPRCAVSGVDRCATLLAPTPNLRLSDRLTLGRLLALQIERLGLYVNLAFLGANFEVEILARLDAARSSALLFFGWWPDVLTVCETGPFLDSTPKEGPQKRHCATKLYLPECLPVESDHADAADSEPDSAAPAAADDSDPPFCFPFDREALKVVWSPLRRRYPIVYDLLRRTHLHRHHLLALLVRFADRTTGLGKAATEFEVRNAVAAGVVCDWLQETENSSTGWRGTWGLKTKTDNINTVIHLGGMYPETEAARWYQPGIKIGVDLAIEKINEDDSILKGYKVVHEPKDTKCEPGPTIKAFIEFMTAEDRNIVGIIGPGCTAGAASLAGVTKFFDYSFISYAAEGVELSELLENNFLRTVPGTTIHKYAFKEFFKHFKWRQALFIAQAGDQAYDSYQKEVRDEILKDLKERGSVRSPEAVFPPVVKIPRGREDENANDDEAMWDVYRDIREKLKSYLNRKEEFRIISVRGEEDMVWRTLCIAFHLDMRWSKGFQWFVPGWFEADWWNLSKMENREGYHWLFREQRQSTPIPAQEGFRCSDTEMRLAVSGSLKITNAFYAELDSEVDVPKTKKGTKVGDLKEEYRKKIKEVNQRRALHGSPPIAESKWAAYAYDATWVYAKALDAYQRQFGPNALRRERIHSKGSTERLVAFLKRIKFRGLSGEVAFDARERGGGGGGGKEGEERKSGKEGKRKERAMSEAEWSPQSEGDVSSDRRATLVFIEQTIIEDEKTTNNYKVARYKFPHSLSRHKNNNNNNASSRESLVVYVDKGDDQRAIRWPRGHSPIVDLLKEKECPISPLDEWFDLDDPRDPGCPNTIIFLNIFVVIVVIVAIAGIFVCFYRNLRRLRRETEKHKLGWVEPNTWLELDDWEMPRQNVVMNRTLGRGAFGTVYGGEALLGAHWVAVAVKTLPHCATTEEKVDFLYEAQMMKQLSHRNIVKLFGVCTRSDRPADQILTVMEFMIHGDVRTFLLSRRSLVTQAVITGHEPESSDVSRRRLTRMALDIAEGLSYLNSINCVHRDLAARNCLVDEAKTVKIADFGMTRRVGESDYYRFTKKAQLPVRWMSPESLADGLYTHKSDVFSFGVILYEIITFGSYPYQGLSNNQVVNFVKAGNIIKLPEGISEDLTNLILTCWHFNPDHRQHIDEVKEILQLDPDLMSPCLDTPVSSVPMMGTGSIEMMPHAAAAAAPAPPRGPAAHFGGASTATAPGKRDRRLSVHDAGAASAPFRVAQRGDAFRWENPLPTIKSDGSVENSSRGAVSEGIHAAASSSRFWGGVGGHEETPPRTPTSLTQLWTNAAKGLGLGGFGGDSGSKEAGVEMKETKGRIKNGHPVLHSSSSPTLDRPLPPARSSLSTPPPSPSPSDACPRTASTVVSASSFSPRAASPRFFIAGSRESLDGGDGGAFETAPSGRGNEAVDEEEEAFTAETRLLQHRPSCPTSNEMKDDEHVASVSAVVSLSATDLSSSSDRTYVNEEIIRLHSSEAGKKRLTQGVDSQGDSAYWSQGALQGLKADRSRVAAAAAAAEGRDAAVVGKP